MHFFDHLIHLVPFFSIIKLPIDKRTDSAGSGFKGYHLLLVHFSGDAFGQFPAEKVVT